MGIEKIIEKLLSHEISKAEAINLVNQRIDSYRNFSLKEFTVEEVTKILPAGHGLLKLRYPHDPKDIQKFKRGDRVDILGHK